MFNQHWSVVKAVNFTLSDDLYFILVKLCVHCISSNALLQQLHWLPVEWHIRFKLATLTYKALHPGRPPYLADLLQYHKTTKSTRLSSTQPLSIPRHNLSFGSWAFRVSAPKVWNSLPFQIRQSESLPTFKRHLKTHCFQSAYLTT